MKRLIYFFAFIALTFIAVGCSKNNNPATPGVERISSDFPNPGIEIFGANTFSTVGSDDLAGC